MSEAAKHSPCKKHQPLDLELSEKRMSRLWNRIRGSRVTTGRLKTAIREFENVLNAASRDVCGNSPGDPPNASMKDRTWLKNSRSSLCSAAAAYRQSRVDEGWQHLNAANREAFHRYSCNQLSIEADRLRIEAKQKLGGWRQETLLKTLSRGYKRSGCPKRSEVTDRPTAVESLQRAQAIMDGHFDNEYLKNSLTAGRVTWTALLIAAALSTFWAVVFLGWTETANESEILNDHQQLIAVYVLGAIGALLSSLRLAGSDVGRIPEVLNRAAIGAVRPLVGMAAATVVVVAAESSFLSPGTSDSVNYIYPLAAAAGFSERLVDRILGSQ